MLIREMKAEEAGILKDFLYEAIFIPEGVEPPERSIVELPELRMYYEDFGSGRADVCMVAEDGGRVVGAAWTRIMNDYGHVDDETPSFAISLYREYRGRGAGTRLMKGMIGLLRTKGFRRASRRSAFGQWTRTLRNISWSVTCEEQNGQNGTSGAGGALPDQRR